MWCCTWNFSRNVTINSLFYITLLYNVRLVVYIYDAFKDKPSVNNFISLVNLPFYTLFIAVHEAKHLLCYNWTRLRQRRPDLLWTLHYAFGWPTNLLTGGQTNISNLFQFLENILIYSTGDFWIKRFYCKMNFHLTIGIKEFKCLWIYVILTVNFRPMLDGVCFWLRKKYQPNSFLVRSCIYLALRI